jgi:hypothetical protein
MDDQPSLTADWSTSRPPVADVPRWVLAWSCRDDAPGIVTEVALGRRDLPAWAADGEIAIRLAGTDGVIHAPDLSASEPARLCRPQAGETPRAVDPAEHLTFRPRCRHFECPGFFDALERVGRLDRPE